MKLKTKITKKQYYRYKAYFYTYLVFMVCISIYVDYQRWINPLGLKPEADPKQHNGAQEFAPPTQFESAITLPNGRPIIISDDERISVELSDEELEVFEELKQMDELSEEEFREKLQSELQ